MDRTKVSLRYTTILPIPTKRNPLYSDLTRRQAQVAALMALVAIEFADQGSELRVDFNGKRSACKVVKLPFYRRPK